MEAPEKWWGWGGGTAKKGTRHNGLHHFNLNMNINAQQAILNAYITNNSSLYNLFLIAIVEISFFLHPPLVITL